MIKRKSVLGRFCALNLACGFSWLVAGCSGDTNTPDATDPTDIIRPDPVSCDENPYAQNCPPLKPAKPPVTGGPNKPPKTTPPTPGELEKEQVENLLKQTCGGCHGNQLTPEQAARGMNYINDLDLLVENDKIFPLDAENSLIIKRMRDRTMPPPGSTLTVNETDIDFIANYINNPDFWPDYEAPAPCVNEPVSFDDLYRDVADDLSDQEDDEREFFRYISLSNRITAGVCANTQLDRDRNALIKMMNMLSINADIEIPEAVDPDRTLYRIDLREYDWDREIVVDDVPFADVWEAIVADNDYAVPFVGEDADDAKEDALTDVPVMFLDSMLDTAIIGNLYYAIVNIDVNLDIDTFISDVLQVDVQANIDQEEAIRAGTTLTLVSRQDRLVEGHRLDIRNGVFYQSFDFEDIAGNDSIFDNPFGFNEGGREAIFTLPNGMLAYIIANADGVIVEDSDILLDSAQGNRRALNSTSCSSCHFAGLIPLVDQVRDVVLDNAIELIQAGQLNQDELELVEAIYLDPAEFADRIDEDNQDFYLGALEDAGLPVRGADPVSSTFNRFDFDVKLADAAGDLGLSPEDLEEELDRLDPRLGVLKELEGADGRPILGTIDRDDFTDVYLESLCILSVALENRPDEAVCATVIQ